MKKKATTRWRIKLGEAGNAAVETALVIPVFIAFMLGLFEFGRAYWVQGTMQDSLIAASRYTMLQSTATNDQIILQAQNALKGVAAAEVTYRVTRAASGGVNYATIEATHNFAPVSGYIPGLNGIVLRRSITVPLV